MKHNIEITVYPEFNCPEGVPTLGTSVFIGTNDDPVTNSVPLENVISDFIEAHIIPGGTISNKDRENLISGLKTTRAILKQYILYIKNIPIEETNEDYKTFV